MRVRTTAFAVLALLAAGALLFASCSGLRCLVRGHSTHMVREDPLDPSCDGWTTMPPVDGMTVYMKGRPSDPPILLLHESPGMLPETVRFADALVARGYRVYLPLFFGRFGGRVGVFRQLLACAGPNFNCFTTRESGVVAKLRHLLGRIGTAGEQKIGIIGMCLTGGMPAALVNERVGAIVLSQPSLPFPMTSHLKASLGVDIAPAVQNKDVKILGLHFCADCLAPRERFDDLSDQLKKLGRPMELYEVPTTNEHAHSILTVEGQRNRCGDVEDKARAALDYTFCFLDRALKNGGCDAQAPGPCRSH